MRGDEEIFKNAQFYMREDFPIFSLVQSKNCMVRTEIAGICRHGLAVTNIDTKTV